MIELKKVSKKFGQITALKNVSFRIRKGEIVGLLGPNGAGKTTTLRIIAGILPPSRGKVFTNGESIGYLPENNPLYDELTVEEFLNFWTEIEGLKEDEQKKAIDFVVRNTNIKEVFYRPISQLSKGYRQRVGLSQAILTQPDILILDEPTEGLDPNQRREIKNLIKKLGRKRTVIVSSHILSEITQVADRIIVIHKGSIVGDDTPANLKKLKSDKTIIELEIRGKAVISQLKKLDGVESVEKVKRNCFLVKTLSDKDLRLEIFELAKKKNWLLLTMYKQEQDLEDVFAQLTKE